MPPKRKTNTKKSKRLSIKNKNVVNVHIHKNTRARSRNSAQSTSSYVVKDSFQPRLPMYHPFNINVPYTHPLQSAITTASTAPLQQPVNVYVGAPLTNNTPTQNTLHNTGTAQATALTTPSSPTARHTPGSPQFPAYTPSLLSSGKSKHSLKPAPPQPSPVKPSFHSLQSEQSDSEQSENDANVLVSSPGLTPSELNRILQHYKINIPKKSGAKEKNWTVQTFIRHNLPFLYNQRIIDPNKELPKPKVVTEGILHYVRSNRLFDTPYHDKTNKNKENLSEIYKHLDSIIHGKPKPPQRDNTPRLDTENTLAESSIEHLLATAKVRNIKIPRKQLNNEHYIRNRLGV